MASDDDRLDMIDMVENKDQRTFGAVQSHELEDYKKTLTVIRDNIVTLEDAKKLAAEVLMMNTENYKQMSKAVRGGKIKSDGKGNITIEDEYPRAV